MITSSGKLFILRVTQALRYDSRYCTIHFEFTVMLILWSEK
jgi:hypothetical protein